MTMAFDVIIIGGGHAGCEAALAASRLGACAALFTLSFDAIAHMPCNPAIGGTSKGHLVREIDALGGAMGVCIDRAYLQSRMLNLSKGPAVHSLRAQADKAAYKAEMLRILNAAGNLRIIQAEVTDFEVSEGGFSVTTAYGTVYEAKAVVLCLGTYLNARCLTGETAEYTGPGGMKRAEAIGRALGRFNIAARRFKTGTPARVSARSIDFSKTEPQYGDVPPTPFSFAHTPEQIAREQLPCHLTYTTLETKEIILANLERSPMYGGLIEGTGARYCPSIEDKIVRFADKERHQVFLEPEGEFSPEIYVQGVSTSLPADVQDALYRSIKGLEHADITRYGYAIEYDVIDSALLNENLGIKAVKGLYTAGQINGTSGYEEAAAQGLIAGANAALFALNKPQFSLSRSEAYIGVMIDDLVTKGVNEPYRMMTARAEYRLILRQDNADARLCGAAYHNGLISEGRYRAVKEKEALIGREIHRLNKSGAAAVLRRPECSYEDLDTAQKAALPRNVAEQVSIQIKYEGYIAKQARQIAEFERLESRALPQSLDYGVIPNLRIEAREKLSRAKPESVGRASRINGVSPADITALLIFLRTIGDG